ncbi:hypothetical protein D3C81_934050 [compost metagenome]
MRLLRVAAEAIAEGQPALQFVQVRLDHFARLAVEGSVRIGQVLRVKVTRNESRVVRPLHSCAGLQHDACPRSAVSRRDRSEAGNSGLILHQDVAPGIDIQKARAGDIEAAVENVAPGRYARDIPRVVVNEQVAGRTDVLSGSAQFLIRRDCRLPQESTGRDDIATGHHPHRPRRFIPGTSGRGKTQRFAAA